MYLAELELQGFKSFASKTRVKFDSGITAIVGPNGCGKSNIVDALRWVLGEQRPSLLRSAAMTNVIFNGTAAKKALGLAEVSVTIINNRGSLPTEFSDVTITRRLYRSGESEYLLNRKQCRLKDITDLFMDTGMGSNAYSVIELNMVEDILDDKNNDRRKLFEEAAGITKFKERKKQTLKKLSDTRADLQRMEDILVEIRKKTRSLQAQASRAERAQKYREELEFLDHAVSKQEYDHVQNELNPLLERIASAYSSKEELQRRLQQLEQNEAAAHEALIEKEQAQNEAQKNVGRISGSVQEAQTHIRITSEKIKNEEEVIRRYEQDIHQAETDIKDLRKNLKVNEENLKKAVSKLESMTSEYKSAADALEETRSLVQKNRKKLDDLGRTHSETGNRINELQNLQVRLESRIENATEEKERLKQEIRESREKTSTFSKDKSAQESKYKLLTAEVEKAEQQLDAARNEREELLEQIDRQKDEIRTLQSKNDAYRSEYQLLKNLSESSDSHPESVQYLREHHHEFTMFEMVSDIFTCDKQLTGALEAVLGEASNFVITANEKESRRAFDLLQKHNKGRLTTIPLSRIADNHNVVDSSLYHHVQCDKIFSSLKKLFFGSVVTADTLDDAIQVADKKKVMAVTPGGDVVTADGFIYSGSRNKNAGVRIGLKEKIIKLQQQAEDAARLIKKAQNRLDEQNEAYRNFDLHRWQLQVKQASTQLQKHETRMSSFEAQTDIYNKSIQDLQGRLETLEETSKKSYEELRNITPEWENCKSRLKEVVHEEITLKSALQEQENVLQRTQTRYNDISLQHQNAENEVDTLKRDIRRFESDVQSIKDRLKHRADEAKSSKDLIILLREQVENAEDEQQALHVAKKEAEYKLKVAEEECSHQRGKINLLEEDLKDARRKKESNQELIHSLELAKSRLEMDQKNINDHIWETYSMTIDQINVELPKETDISTARETIFTLRERLKNIGEVNPLAITEYEEEKERLDHFEGQIDDLEKAEEQLTETINEINRNAQERFNNTFKEIRENFRKVFNTLFEENDFCDLKIDEESEDPLEAKIEIIANPRGKRPSVIEQLSGGEKTLTAIALLFALYLVKPSPFCVMDEVDAPLDDPNILRFTKLLKKFSDQTQFIVITHNKTTMEKSEMMYGVTMPETGVSKLVGVRLDEVAA
ncbi:MAG: chromosome segregation protein SMC [Balneolales bacterium]